MKQKTFFYWQKRILIGIILGYASFYLLRQNFSVVTIALQNEFGYSKTQLGLILSCHAIIYGFGKGIWGAISDRSNARYFMVLGLVFAAVANILMSSANHLWFFIGFWSLNACFLSMGAPPCIRLLTHWFSPKEIATKWAIWNSAQQIGAASTVVLAASLVELIGWRSAFYGPAIISFGLAFLLFLLLRDTPQSIGLPSIEVFSKIDKNTSHHEEELTLKEIIFDKVLKNKLVLYMSVANMFFYIIRIGVLNWAPTFLIEVKGFDLKMSGWQTAIFDVAGVTGGIVSGWICDQWFSNRRGIVVAIFVLFLGLTMWFLWLVPPHSYWISGLTMMILGFFVSGPQILIGVAAADFASKKAAGAANGLTGTFGYLGAALSGVMIGWVAENWGWEIAVYMFMAAALLCAFFSLLTLQSQRVLRSETKEELLAKAS